MAKKKATPPTDGRRRGGPAKKNQGDGGERGGSGGKTKPPRGADQQTIFLAGLDRFADRLKKDMKEALKFSSTFLSRTGDWPLTKKGNTRFANRAQGTAGQLRLRHGEFRTLAKDCPKDSLCRALIETLRDACLGKTLLRVADKLEEIADRARQPLTPGEQRDLRKEMHALNGVLTNLLIFAGEVLKATEQIRDAHRTLQSTESGLPAEVVDWLGEAKQAATNFVGFLATNCPVEPGEEESAFEFVNVLEQERKRIERETETFSKIFQKPGTHEEIAEQPGHEKLLKLLERKQEAIAFAKAYRNVAGGLIRALVHELKARLSYGEDEAVNESVHKILHALGRYSEAAEKQLHVLQDMEIEVAAERAASAARMTDIPDWGQLVGARKGDGSELAGLKELVEVLCDLTETGAVDPRGATSQQLLDRHNTLFPESAVSESTIKRRIEEAEKRQIVVQYPRKKGESGRVPFFFLLTEAAAKNYGPYLPAVHSSPD